MNNMPNSPTMKNVNPLLNMSDLLINFFGISFSILRGIVKNACYEKY